jgi:hypothetical protein
MNISLVVATLLALTVSMKSLHVLGTVQIGAPTTPVVFSTIVSVYVIGGLVGVSVPLGGVGALGTTGAADLAVLLRGTCFFGPIVRFDPVPAKARTATESPEMQRRAPNRLRFLIKPDLGEECFFIGIIPGGLIARIQARGAVPLRHLSQNMSFVRH